MYSLIIAGIILVVVASIFMYTRENFTNMAGYFTDKSSCSSMTLRDCMNTSTCSWCMGDEFSPKCVSGQSADLLSSGKCKKVYANDAWTRALLSADNDYVDSKYPLFE